MGEESWSPPSIFLSADVGRRLFPEFFTGKTEAVAASRGEEIRTKDGLLRTKCVRPRDLTASFSLSPLFAGPRREARSWRMGGRGGCGNSSKRRVPLGRPRPRLS